MDPCLEAVKAGLNCTATINISPPYTFSAVMVGLVAFFAVFIVAIIAWAYVESRDHHR